MIQIEVRNKAGVARRWQVEPYGDMVLLQHDDVLTIDFEHDADLAFEVVLNPELDVLWPDPDGHGPDEVSVASDVKVIGVSLWSSPDSRGAD